MESTLTLYRTTVGKKVVMAASGVVLFGFVIVHMLGNLNIYLGPEAMYAYAKGLREMPYGLLWVARIGLLVAFLAHWATSVQLAMLNKKARTTRYAKQQDLATNYAAKSMYLTGPVMLLYIFYHLAHLTFGVTGPEGFDPFNPYNNFVAGFQVWWISGIYIVANVAVCMHLYHGVWSVFQSLGVNHKRFNALRRQAATAIVGVILAGNLSFPIAVLAGVLQPKPCTTCQANWGK